MEHWEIKNTSSFNRFLKVRTHITDTTKPILLTITHKYNTSDDMLFPLPQTLAFVHGLEEHLLEKQSDLEYFASDIDNGIVNLYAYINDPDKAIHYCIEYCKKYPSYKVDFHLQNDPSHSLFSKLKDL